MKALPPVMPQAIIFDWDNTLTDTRTTIADALNDTRRAFGLPVWTLDEIKLNSARSLRESFPEYFGDRWGEARDYFYNRITATHLKTIKPLPEVDKALRKIHDLGILMAVVSNKRGDLLRDEADVLGWTNLFVQLVGATDAPHDKPSRETVALALSKTQLSLDNPAIWFVGDAEIDMQTGRNAGCTCIFIGDTAKGREFRADFVFSDCTKLAELLYNDSKQAPTKGIKS